MIDPAEVWIVVPAFNEGAVVSSVVEGLRALYPNVVAVDDGSTDDTFQRLLQTGAVVVRHVVNLGQGAALQTGIDYALMRGARYLVTFDADGQHRVEDIGALLTRLVEGGADIALGSRFIGNERPAMPRGRRLLLRAAVAFTRVVGGLRVSDAHNGLRALTSATARRLRITQPRMAHASEILHGIVKHQLKYVEVPVSVLYTDYSRAKGQSALEALNIMFDLLLRRLGDG